MTGPEDGSIDEFLHMRRLVRCAVFAIALILFLDALPSDVHAQEDRPKRVLLISTGSRLAPGFIIVDQQLLKVLSTLQSPRTEIYAENLDIVRFPVERSQRIFSEYLSAKYAEQPPDLVILIYVGNLGITASVLERLFPSVPIIVAGFTEEELRAEQFGKLVSGLAQRVDADATLKLMLRLQPQLRHVVVIGGTAGVDRQMLARVRAATEAFRDRVAFEFWDELPMSEIKRRVIGLPSDTAVLYTRMFRDAAGHGFISAEVGQWIGQNANVPVYTLVDTTLGTGALGGSIASAEAFGQRAGEMARRILTGTSSQALQFEISNTTVPTFDWRALKRWGISESRLPPDSVVLFKPLSIWEQYRWYITGALVIILLQSSMIVALFLETRSRRRMQTALQENQQLMELAAGAGELGLWSRSLTDNSVWANAPTRALLGLNARDELRFDDLMARIHPDDRNRVADEVARAEAAGLAFETEFRTRLPDGSERWVLSRGRNIITGRGRDSRRMGVLMDITARKRAEESLDQQRAFLRQVIDINPNFIFAKDREGRFTLANKAVADAYGVTVDELIGKTDADLNANPREVEFFRRTDLEVMNTMRERFIAEERITDATGKVRWLQTVKRPIVDSSGAANQVLGASTDITERKKTETELQKQRAEAAHVARVSLMGELSASLAHELNQPLTAILVNAKAGLRFASRESIDVGEVREALSDIVEAGERAAQVVVRVKALLKKEESIEFATIDLASLIHDVVVLLRSDAVLQDVRISLELDNDLPTVRGDRVQLQQVLLNILINAFDAMKACAANDRQVKVRAALRDDMVCVAVSDLGTGLSSEERERVFEPFYTTKREGLGMGLSICRSIMEAHGGSLWAENNPEGGATFYFTLPVFEPVITVVPTAH